MTGVVPDLRNRASWGADTCMTDANSKANSPGLSLARFSAVATSLLTILVAALVAGFLYAEWKTLGATREALRATGVANKAMILAEKTSFERGPSNSLMGDSDTPDPTIRERLVKARQATDAALQDLLLAVSEQSCVPDCDMARRIREIAERLLKVRALVEQVGAMPLRERTAERVNEVIQHMFDLIPGIIGMASELSRQATEIDSEIEPLLAGAMFVVEMREYGGRLGSQFTPPLTTGQPLSASAHRNVDFYSGRIEQLHDLIVVHTKKAAANPAIQEALEKVERDYIRDGLALARSIRQASDDGKPYGFSNAEFIRRYVPYMKSIVELRDAMMQSALDAASAQHDEAVRKMLIVVVLAAAILCLLGLLFAVVRWRVVNPMLEVTAAIVELGRGNLDTPLPEGGRSEEIARLQRAVSVLRSNSIEKRRLEEQQGRIIESIPGIFYLFDSNGRFLLWNRNLEVVLERSAEEIRRGHPLDFFDEYDRPRIESSIRRSFETGSTTVEAALISKSGRRMPYYFNGFRFEVDGYPALIGVGIDISERVEAQGQLERYRDHLEELVADRTKELRSALLEAEAARLAKSTFLTNVSHEMRTPLHQINGFMQLLRRDPLTPKQTGRLEKMEVSCRRMAHIVDSLLELTRLESSAPDLLEVPVDPGGVLAEVMAAAKGEADAKGLSITRETGDLPGSFKGDTGRIRQALYNYVHNAIRFTESGGVILRCRIEQEDEREALIRFEVQDSGIGISPENQARLFRSFEQADNSMTRQFGGLGVGLTLTYRTARLMGGNAGCESRLGEGSLFWFTVRLSKA